MKKLPHNCRVGKMSVYPKNWYKSKSSMKVTWKIIYLFYDDKTKQKAQIRKKGMNDLHVWEARKDITIKLMSDEMKVLEAGYNPITDQQIIDTPSNMDVPTEHTPFNQALDMALKSIDVEKHTKEDLTSVSGFIKMAADVIRINGKLISQTPIGEIRKRDIRALFDYLSKRRNWTNNTYNYYRSHMMMFYKELGEFDAVESNIPRELSKKNTVKATRILLTPDQRKKVKEKIISKNYRYWLFINMFFHSGARITEFCRLKISDVNLERQTATFLIKKRKQWMRVAKPIKNIALPFWEQYLKNFTDPNHYVVSWRLKPGPDQIRTEQITRRWKNWVKKDKDLNICADFYALKHLNTDEVSDLVGIEKAQKLNSHTSDRTTRIYAINETAREMEIIKRVGNEF